MEEKSLTNGVKPFPIQGPFFRERERLAGAGMTDAERKMRAQWIKDQMLAPNEPVYIPEIERELTNPIRRFYKYPLDRIFQALEPALGKTVAPNLRYFTGKLFIGLFIVYSTIYYCKYNAGDWTRTSGWRITESRTRVLPGDPGYPQTSAFKKPQDFNTRGFENSPI